MTYRFRSIEVPDHNPFANDCLSRSFAVTFIADLIGRAHDSGPFVIAIDAPYGSGKSTFVEMLRGVLRQRDYFSVQFNAWDVDYATDPLVAIIAALDSEIKASDFAPSGLKTALKSVKNVATAISKRSILAGIKIATFGALELDKEVEKIAADLAAESSSDLIAEFHNQENLKSKFRSSMVNIVQNIRKGGKKGALIFFIDELDRCRPDFAMSLLERIKHLFDVPDVVFVLSIDKRQLTSATAAVYGQGIDAEEYLRKFIDIDFGLPRAKTKPFVEMAIVRCGLSEIFASRTPADFQPLQEQAQFVNFFSVMADSLQLSLRAIERCIIRLKVVFDQTESHAYLNPIFVALLTIIRATDNPMYKRIVTGLDSSAALLQYFEAKGVGLPMDSWIVIEANLAANDPNDLRRNQLRARYDSLIASTPTPPEERRKAQRFIGIFEFAERRDDVRGESLRIVASRVDMAGHIQE
jgi:energy-coupling factor transporter ATP-binding protein EcfA2